MTGRVEADPVGRRAVGHAPERRPRFERVHVLGLALRVLDEADRPELRALGRLLQAMNVRSGDRSGFFALPSVDAWIAAAVLGCPEAVVADLLLDYGVLVYGVSGERDGRSLRRLRLADSLLWGEEARR